MLLLRHPVTLSHLAMHFKVFYSIFFAVSFSLSAVESIKNANKDIQCSRIQLNDRKNRRLLLSQKSNPESTAAASNLHFLAKQKSIQSKSFKGRRIEISNKYVEDNLYVEDTVCEPNETPMSCLNHPSGKCGWIYPKQCGTEYGRCEKWDDSDESGGKSSGGSEKMSKEEACHAWAAGVSHVTHSDSDPRHPKNYGAVCPHEEQNLAAANEEVERIEAAKLEQSDDLIEEHAKEAISKGGPVVTSSGPGPDEDSVDSSPQVPEEPPVDPDLHCKSGDIKIRAGSLTTDAGALVDVFDGSTKKWHPLCGHYFWNNDNGASTICRYLGYPEGGKRVNAHKSGGDSIEIDLGGDFGKKKLDDVVYEQDAMFVGQCKEKERMNECSDNGNHWGDFEARNGEGWCKSGKKELAVGIKCFGDRLSSEEDASRHVARHDSCGKEQVFPPPKGSKPTDKEREMCMAGDVKINDMYTDKFGNKNENKFIIDTYSEKYKHWYPICGHYFWDSDDGAKRVCQMLGYQGGGRRHHNHKKFNENNGKALDAMPVGKCKFGDAIMNYNYNHQKKYDAFDAGLNQCSHGGNAWDQFDDRNKWCRAGEGISVIVECHGSQVDSRKNSCGEKPEMMTGPRGVKATDQELGLCKPGDVKIHSGDPKSGNMIVSVFSGKTSKFHPICGHYFWDNKKGANTVCQKLGFKKGVKKINRSREKFGSKHGSEKDSPPSLDSMPIGKCRNREKDLTHCSRGGNAFDNFQDRNGWCEAGNDIGITIECKGDSEDGRKSSCGKESA